MSSGLVSIQGMAKLLTQLKGYPKFLEAQATEMLRKNTRLLVSSSGKVPGLVQVTPPFSEKTTGGAAKKQGEGAVMRDIWRVYGGPGKVFKALVDKGHGLAARAFWQNVKVKKWAEAEVIMRRCLGVGFEVFDDGAAHMRRRNKQGRVVGKRVSLFVQDAKPVKAYLKRRQRNVGLLAASIPVTYNGRYGALKGVPAWIARHRSSWAGGSMQERKTWRRGTEVRIAVNGKSLDAEMQRRFGYVLDYRLRAMEREAPYVIKAAARAAGLLP